MKMFFQLFHHVLPVKLLFTTHPYSGLSFCHLRQKQKLLRMICWGGKDVNPCFKLNSTWLGSPREHSPVWVEQADERRLQFVVFSIASVENVAGLSKEVKEKTTEANYIANVMADARWDYVRYFTSWPLTLLVHTDLINLHNLYKYDSVPRLRLNSRWAGTKWNHRFSCKELWDGIISLPS